MYRGLGNKLHYLSLSLLNQNIKVYAFNSGNNKMYHLKELNCKSHAFSSEFTKRNSSNGLQIQCISVTFTHTNNNKLNSKYCVPKCSLILRQASRTIFFHTIFTSGSLHAHNLYRLRLSRHCVTDSPNKQRSVHYVILLISIQVNYFEAKFIF
jgi:hypothetical protein